MYHILELIQRPKKAIEDIITNPPNRWNVTSHIAFLVALYIVYAWILTNYQISQVHTTIDTFTHIFIIAAGLLAPIGWITYSLLINIFAGAKLKKPQLHHIFHITLYIYIATLIPTVALTYLAADSGSPIIFSSINILVYLWGLYLGVLAVMRIYHKKVRRSLIIVTISNILQNTIVTLVAMGLIIIVDNFGPRI